MSKNPHLIDISAEGAGQNVQETRLIDTSAVGGGQNVQEPPFNIHFRKGSMPTCPLKGEFTKIDISLT